MNKKGFSIVEVVMVLILLGGVLWLVMNGKFLIDTMRVKSEIATLDKFSNALAFYRVERSGAPMKTNDKVNVDPTVFLQKGLIAADDMYSKLSESSWELVLCKPGPNGQYFELDPSGGKTVCARMKNERYDGFATCYIDKLDDKSLISGQVRAHMKKPTTPIIEYRYYDDCYSLRGQGYDFMYQFIK